MLIAASQKSKKANTKLQTFLICFFIVSCFFYGKFNALSFAKGENNRELAHCLIQARIQYDNSHYKEALDWWEKALKLDPQNKEALKYVEKARAKMPKTEKPEPHPPSPAPAAELNQPKLPVEGPTEKAEIKSEQPPVLAQAKAENAKSEEKKESVSSANMNVEKPKENKPALSEPVKKETPKPETVKLTPPEQKKSIFQKLFSWTGAVKNEPRNTGQVSKKEQKTAALPAVKAPPAQQAKARSPAPDAENLPAGVKGKDKDGLTHCLMQGRIQYDNGHYKEALDWWNKALKLDPQNKEALKYRKKSQEKVSKVHAKRIELYIVQGKKYYCQNRYNWAISEWQTALRMDPDNQEVRQYIERARGKMKQKPPERGPAEEDMLPVKPEPENPEPVFKQPDKDMLTLDDSIKIGIINHLPLQIAREQVKLSRFKEKESFRELFPAASIRWDETKGVITSRNYAGRKYQVRMDHPLYHGGELRYTWEQAKVNLRISQENYEKTKEEYLLQLSKAYYDYVKAIKNLEIQDYLLKDLEKDLAISKKEYESKITGLVDFLNVQSQYNQAYYASLSSDNTLSLAKSNFLQLLNLDRNSTIDIKINTEMLFKDFNIDLSKCLELAYQKRTDLKINELGLKSAELGEKVAASQQLPKIDLTGSVGKAGEALNPGNLQLSNDWFVGAKVNVPWGPNSVNYSLTKEDVAPSVSVFQPTKDTTSSFRFNILDNLASYTEAKRSEVNRQQAYADMVKGKQTVETEVREAYFSYQESVIKVKNSIANKDLYKKELEIIKQKRLMDEAQTQDLVAAKVKLSGEESNYVSVLVDNVEALEKLNKAIGERGYFK